MWRTSIPAPRGNAGEELLRVEDLAGRAKPGLRFARACIAAKCVGIAGLVGAGRTELLRAIFGLDPDSQPARSKLARYSGPASPRGRWAQGMGMVSEDRKIPGPAPSA